MTDLRKAAVLFDLDGTLVDSARYVAAAVNVLRAKRGIGPVEPTLVRRTISLGAAEIVKQCLEQGASDTHADVSEFRAALSEVRGDPRDVYDGVRAALEGLRERGAALGIVTNKPFALTVPLLTQLELNDYFDVIVGGDTAERPKPDAAPIHYAMQRVQPRAARALYVGDSMVDAEAALAARVPFLLFSEGYGGDQIDAARCAGVFAHYGELVDLASKVFAHKGPRD